MGSYKGISCKTNGYSWEAHKTLQSEPLPFAFKGFLESANSALPVLIQDSCLFFPPSVSVQVCTSISLLPPPDPIHPDYSFQLFVASYFWNVVLVTLCVARSLSYIFPFSAGQALHLIPQSLPPPTHTHPVGPFSEAFSPKCSLTPLVALIFGHRD